MVKLKIISVILLIITITSTISCSSVKANSGTMVTHDILTDTVWTMENSPYILKDDITIQPGVSLTIMEGVIVDFSLWSLQVEGELRAFGSAENHIEFHFTVQPLTGYKHARIVFTEESRRWKDTTNRGCRLEYVDMYCSENTVQYGLIEGGTLRLDYITVHDSEPYSKHYTLEFNGSITNSKFVDVTRAINMGQGEIIGNYFINTSSTVITIRDGLVRDNYIDGGKRGVTVKNALLKNNIILNIESRGINIYNKPILGSTDTPRPIIHSNLIANCEEQAVYVSGNIKPIMTQNVIIGNIYGVFFDEDAFYMDVTPRFYYNAFYGNEFNVYFNREDPRIDVNLRDNWWGTNDTEVMEDKIYYECDDPRITAALYQPFLTEPPYYLPEIPFKLMLSLPDIEPKVGGMVSLTGGIYPPLEEQYLQFKINGPNGENIQRSINTDSEGLFAESFSPNSTGIWEINIEFMGNELLEAKSTSANILVAEGFSNSTQDEETEAEKTPIENTSQPEPEEPITQPNPEQETQETPESEYISDASNFDQVETIEETSDDVPDIFGLIPSALSFIIMVALYFAVNIVKR